MKTTLVRLRALGRRVRRLKNGRYDVSGVWPSVRAEDLEIVAAALEARHGSRMD